MFKKIPFYVLGALVLGIITFTVANASSNTLLINVKTDNSTYRFGDTITVTLEAENKTGEDIQLSFSSGCQMQFEAYMYRSATSAYTLPAFNDDLYPRNCDPKATTITIPNDKKAIWTRVFNQSGTTLPPLLPGDYIMHAFISEHEDREWANQLDSYVKFTVDPTLGGAEGSECNHDGDCYPKLDCSYYGLFINLGYCTDGPYPYDDEGFKEQLCVGTGGNYVVDCSCPIGYDWNNSIGCSKNIARDQKCLTSGGIVTESSSIPCTCSEGEIYNVTEGCISGHETGFNDIKGHWAEEFITDLYYRGVISGYEDGGFHPNDNINRAELVKLSLATAGISEQQPAGDLEFKFTDLDEWQIGWIYAAWERDIVKGYSDAVFSPSKNVTRAEALKISMLAFGMNVPDTSDKWAFGDTVDHWAVSYINEAYLKFIISGRADGNFYPNDPITRAEASKIINLLAEK